MTQMAAEPDPTTESHATDTEPPENRGGGRTGKKRATSAVRYGQMGFVGEFTHASDAKCSCGTKVVIQTKRGIEIGQQLPLASHACPASVSNEQLRSYVAASGSEYCSPECGRILREATEEDLADYDRILAGGEERRESCQDFARRHNLDMRVVACEPLFGGERIIFYFVAEGRVDFRTLVKDLAHEFQTRIEMRQVGARDEARLVADYETCGRECCCKNFLKNLRPVSMKMAKMQKATLDPSKVSGRCGRLKCCLRYENESYEEMDRRLPRMGSRVRTQQGEGRVVARQILTQLIQFETDEGGRIVISVDEILKPGEEPTPPRPAEPPVADVKAGAREPRGSGEARPRSRGRGRGGRRNPRRDEPSPATTDSAGKDHPDAPGSETPPADRGSSDSAAATPKRKRRRRSRGPRRGGQNGGNNASDGGPPPNSGD